MVIVTLGEVKEDKDEPFSVGEADSNGVWDEVAETDVIIALLVALAEDVDVALAEDVEEALLEDVEAATLEHVDVADEDDEADAVAVALTCSGEGEGISELLYEYVMYSLLESVLADDKRVEPSNEHCNENP